MSLITDDLFRSALFTRRDEAAERLSNFAAMTIAGQSDESIMLQQVQERVQGEDMTHYAVLGDVMDALLSSVSVVNSRRFPEMHDDYHRNLERLDTKIDSIVNNIETRCSHPEINQPNIRALKEALGVFRDMITADGPKAMEENYRKLIKLTPAQQPDLY